MGEQSKRRRRIDAPFLAAIGAWLIGAASPAWSQGACPSADAAGVRRFADGALLMRTGLNVNPDGAAQSYLPGDHGFTYIANGVNYWRDGAWRPCKGPCRSLWLAAEDRGFAAGTAKFCVFAMEVEALPGGQKTQCQEPGRYVVGDGQGRPKAGAMVPAIGGGQTPSYLSTTTLRHRRNGAVSYVDSVVIPGVVVPKTQPGLVGAVAWVRWNGRDAFAIVNDTGPAFGEGSVALHQLLRNGAIGPVQAVGPISLAMRCTAAERDLKPPFSLRPDVTGDLCRSGRTPQGAADVRAYEGIGSGVETIILSNVKAPMSAGRVVDEEITTDRLKAWAQAAGYTPEKLAAMAACQ